MNSDTLIGPGNNDYGRRRPNLEWWTIKPYHQSKESGVFHKIQTKIDIYGEKYSVTYCGRPVKTKIRSFVVDGKNTLCVRCFNAALREKEKAGG